MIVERAVLHVDLDMFFVAAELRRRPELRGRPVLVAGHGSRAVVASASYEARQFGIRSGMALVEARRRCPEAIVLRTDSAYYRELSRSFRQLLGSLTDRIEMLSIDEACLEIGKRVRWPDTVRCAGEELRARVAQELGLTATIGAATNRTVAKIAAELAKPNGFRLVEPGEEAAFLAPLPVEVLPGIGPRAATELRRLGIERLGQLAAAPSHLLEPVFGRRADLVRELASGRDLRPVGVGRKVPKSLGHEETFAQDLSDPRQIEAETLRLADRVASELRSAGLQGRIVVVKVRFADFRTMTRQRALGEPSADGAVIGQVARELVRVLLAKEREPVRLLGVRMTGLSERALQLPLLDTASDRLRRERLLAALDALRARGLPVRPGWVPEAHD